jgi:hypothetical protein
MKVRRKPVMTKRMSVSIPDLTHEKLQVWADIEGTSLADLAAYLLRREVEIAEKEGKLKYPDENVNKNPQS